MLLLAFLLLPLFRLTTIVAESQENEILRECRRSVKRYTKLYYKQQELIEVVKRFAVTFQDLYNRRDQFLLPELRGDYCTKLYEQHSIERRFYRVYIPQMKKFLWELDYLPKTIRNRSKIVFLRRVNESLASCNEYAKPIGELDMINDFFHQTAFRTMKSLFEPILKDIAPVGWEQTGTLKFNDKNQCRKHLIGYLAGRDTRFKVYDFFRTAISTIPAVYFNATLSIEELYPEFDPHNSGLPINTNDTACRRLVDQYNRLFFKQKEIIHILRKYARKFKKLYERRKDFSLASVKKNDEDHCWNLYEKHETERKFYQDYLIPIYDMRRELEFLPETVFNRAEVYLLNRESKKIELCDKYPKAIKKLKQSVEGSNLQIKIFFWRRIESLEKSIAPVGWESNRTFEFNRQNNCRKHRRGYRSGRKNRKNVHSFIKELMTLLPNRYYKLGKADVGDEVLFWSKIRE